MKVNQYSSEINENLIILISEVGFELRDIKSLTSITADHMVRKSYSIEFTNGVILKGRVFESEYDAFKVSNLWKYLSIEHFPKLISSKSNVLLLEWIGGETLCDLNYDLPLDVYRLCGDIQGRVHITKADKEDIHSCSKYTELKVSDAVERTIKDIKELFKYGIIDQQKMEILTNYLENHAPENLQIGLILGDFCPENIVINDSGNIYIIDNEKLSIDSYNYDLARTYYRWPMSKDQLRAYIEGYEEHRSYESFRKYCSFWIIKVIVKSVLFRLKCGSILYKEPLSKLEIILGNLLTGQESGIDNITGINLDFV